MHDRDGLRVAQCSEDGLTIADVAAHEPDRPLRKLRGDPIDSLRVPGRQIVVHDDVVPGGRKRFAGVAADIPGATGDQHRAHGRPIEV